ncbi:MAG: hypothetical protein ACFFD4_12065, partial [Candidatus Odinarchaeota archaeon]
AGGGSKNMELEVEYKTKNGYDFNSYKPKPPSNALNDDPYDHGLFAGKKACLNPIKAVLSSIKDGDTSDLQVTD